MKKRVLSVLILSCMITGIFGGCGKEENMADSQIQVEIGEEVEKDTEAESKANLFEDISDWEFWFGSGAGAWSTVLTVNADGTFQGNHHDSDMGDMGDEYPNGTCYWCDFTGKFTEPVQVNDYTWSFEIESIELKNEPETEEILDGVKYVYSEPYGLTDAQELLIYTPGAPVKELPESYLDWIYFSVESEAESLPFYGLYNVNTQDGFSSYEASETADIMTELSELEQKAKEIEDQLENDEDLSQTDKNLLSEELYNLWDEKLNDIWGRLKELLDEESMMALTDEELDWIADKEGELQKIVEEYHEAETRIMMCNKKAAEMTKERVYELAEYLK